MELSIWDEKEDYISLSDNSETTIWEDLERDISKTRIQEQHSPPAIAPTPANRNNADILRNKNKNSSNTLQNNDFSMKNMWGSMENKHFGNSYSPGSAIWDETGIETKKIYTQMKKSNKVSNDKKNEYFVEEQDSPVLGARNSRAVPNISDSYSPISRMRASHVASSAGDVYSTVTMGTRSPGVINSNARTIRCHSGAHDPSACTGRIAAGPDHTIGFHQGRAGGYCRARDDASSLRSAYKAMNKLKKIEIQHQTGRKQGSNRTQSTNVLQTVSIPRHSSTGNTPFPNIKKSSRCINFSNKIFPPFLEYGQKEKWITPNSLKNSSRRISINSLTMPSRRVALNSNGSRSYSTPASPDLFRYSSKVLIEQIGNVLDGETGKCRNNSSNSLFTADLSVVSSPSRSRLLGSFIR